MRTLPKVLEQYKYPIKLAKDRIPEVKEYCVKAYNEGKSKNQILGLIMQTEDIGSTFAHNLYRSFAIDTVYKA